MTVRGGAQERPRRAEVLQVLRNADAPLGVADVAERIGIHVNTARFHLDALVAVGAVARTLGQPSGPGRPRTVYAPRPGMDRGGTRSYRLLAQILLSQLSSAGPEAGKTATQAGRAWGRFLAGPPPPFQQLTDEQVTTRLITLLAGLGFAPEAGDDVPVPAVIRLRHCPFLELAEGYDQLVCRIHLGLMQGALAELHTPVTATRLEPFAEPGACLAHLEHAGAA
ncbi:MAG: helix-turn-helix domain-containing protein [Actinomycetota bacterium]|nr:helix-turn-helix domain-containing protein [Actinomycetota bacterium]